MLNLNYNTTFTSLNSQPRAIEKFNYSASLLVAGGGAGVPALTASAARGGGGAGFVWTGSLTIIPNLTYSIYVAETSSAGLKGNESKIVGFDGNDDIAFQVTAFGGEIQTYNSSVGAYNGGAGGSGSLVRAGVTTLYKGFVGGLPSTGIRGGFTQVAGGGGAGARGNGYDGNINSDPMAGKGGPGYDVGFPTSATIAVGGTGQAIGTFGSQQIISASQYSQGSSLIYNTSNAVTGSRGGITISYAGQPKAFITNGTTTYSGGTTYHVFNPGTGSFYYQYPYPWPDVPSGSFPQ